MAHPYEELWDRPWSTPQSRGADPTSEPPYIPHFWGNIVAGVVKAILKVAFRQSNEGLDKVRQFAGESGVLVVSNHESFLDPAFILCGQFPRCRVRFMARENMFANAHRLAGHIISRVGAFPIKRDTADRTAIKRAAAMLKRGEVVGIFPEGTRRGKGNVEIALHNGAAFIARMGKAPIVPCSPRNAGAIMRKGEKFPHFPKVTVVFGDPIFLADFDFLPKEDRLDACSWYAMRECYALRDNIPREQVDMKALFPEARDFSDALDGHDFTHKEA